MPLLAPRRWPSAPPQRQPRRAGGPDFSSLERHLVKITSQIEALQRPDHIEQSIAAFRSELAEIRHAITEAMPRRAIESIENEIRSLSRRIDDNRQNGTDGQALAGIERALGEIREALRSLTPAEQLAGYDDAIRNLGAKLDLILRANDDPSTVHQLEGAIAALRSIVSNVASNDALARLVRRRAHAVGQGRSARPHRRSRRFLRHPRAAHRRADLDAGKPRAAGRQATIPNSSKARCARCPSASTACRSATTTPRPSPISNSACRICWSGSRPPPDPGAGNLGRVEEGLQDILRHLERQHANLVALAESNRQLSAPAPPPIDSGIVDMVKRELSDIRFSQSETDRRTQDSLETVHNTLGHVVDRLAMIEGDLRAVRAAPLAPRAAAGLHAASNRAAPRPPRAATPPAMRAAAETRIAKSAQPTASRAASAGPFRRRAARIPSPRSRRPPAGAAAAAARHQRNPRAARRAAARRDRAGTAAGSSARAGHAAGRAGVVAVRAHRRLRKRDQRNFRGGRKSRSAHRASSPPRAAPRRPPPPQPVNEKAAARGKARLRQRPRPATSQGPEQGTLDHHLQDPLAAGRRQRGRDRARHLQDGDDAARHRQRAADAGDGEFERTGARSAAPMQARRDLPRRRRPQRPR